MVDVWTPTNTPQVGVGLRDLGLPDLLGQIWRSSLDGQKCLNRPVRTFGVALRASSTQITKWTSRCPRTRPDVSVEIWLGGGHPTLHPQSPLFVCPMFNGEMEKEGEERVGL